MELEALADRARAVVNPRTLSDSASCGTVGAAIRTASGDVFVGVCVDTASSLGFCAEHAAAAAMLTAGQNVVTAMVAVGRDGGLMPPCGRCREFISQLAPENLAARVLVADNTVAVLRELMPYRWPDPGSEPAHSPDDVPPQSLGEAPQEGEPSTRAGVAHRG